MRELSRQVAIVPSSLVRNAPRLIASAFVSRKDAAAAHIIEYYYKTMRWATSDRRRHIACCGGPPEEMNDIADWHPLERLMCGFAAIASPGRFKLEFGRVWENEYPRIILPTNSPDGGRVDGHASEREAARNASASTSAAKPKLSGNRPTLRPARRKRPNVSISTPEEARDC